MRHFILVCALTLTGAVLAADPAANSKDDAKRGNRVEIKIKGDFRVITSNGIPDHEPGKFPNRRNPNTISEQDYEFYVPLKPQAAEKPVRMRMQPFGVALNGVVFDPFANEFWKRDRESGWQYEPLSGQYDLGTDASNAHVQPDGSYHYHGMPNGLIAMLNAGGLVRMLQIGWAADGYPIYAMNAHGDAKDPLSALKKMKSSYQLKSGTRPDGDKGPGGKYDGLFVQDYEYVSGSGDLDECNGRFGVTPQFPEGTYYYMLTEEFPFIPRYFHGIPDRSFFRGPPPGGGPPPGPGGPFPGGHRGPPPRPPREN
jgi:hypothetical protein